MFGIYCLAVLGGGPYLIWGSQTIRSTPWFPQYLTVMQLFLALHLLLVVGLLFYDYRHANSASVRGRIRIVVLGGVISALPLVTLTILPDALLQQTIVSYSSAFMLLSVLPLTYGYAIIRHRLIAYEKHVNRGATFILVYSILGAFYLILYAILHRWLSINLEQDPLINTLLVLVLATVFVPLHRRVQSYVDTVFYGGWYDYRSAVMQITYGLEQINELQSLARTVGERLVSTLHLEDTCIFFRDPDGNFSVIEVVPEAKVTPEHPLSFTAVPKSSLTYLLRIGDVERHSLQQALSEVALSPEEQQLLSSDQTYLWIPVIGHGRIQGMLALGPRFGGDIFSGEDLDILRVVARQIGPMIENIHLVSRLRQHALELEQRVKERTAELHDAKERVEAILASVGDGVIVTGLDGSILTVNAAFEEQSGYTAQELVGQALYSLMADQEDSGLLEEIQKTLGEGQIWRGELVGRRKGGETYDAHLTMAPVRDQSGQIMSYVGSQRDITQQKELDRLKDRFVSDVSHELRTPTTNISLFLELLEETPPEKQSEYISIIKDQSMLLRKLVEDILDLSRLTMGKVRRIELAPIDLNELIEQVVLAHIPMVEAAGLELKFEACDELPLVLGEENQLSRAVTNLVANAVRYTLEGEVRIKTSSSNGRVMLDVSDTGIGIDPDDMQNLFQRFYRGRRVRQSKIAGTGLGLAIVKEIVDLHAGGIEVHSEPGRGSTFSVWLPLIKE